MPDCNYCTKTFPDTEEEEYLTHLVDNHESELGRIDHRRIEDHPEVTLQPTYQTAKLVLQTLIILAVIGVLVAVVYFMVMSDAYGGAMMIDAAMPVLR
jgi:hypothetical protein